MLQLSHRNTFELIKQNDLTTFISLIRITPEQYGIYLHMLLNHEPSEEHD